MATVQAGSGADVQRCLAANSSNSFPGRWTDSSAPWKKYCSATGFRDPTWPPWRLSVAARASRWSPPDCRGVCRCRSSPRRSPCTAPPSARRCSANCNRRRAPQPRRVPSSRTRPNWWPPTDEMTQAARGARAGDDGPVAWSQDADAAEPVPYTGPEHTSDYGRESTGFGYADDERYGAQAARLPWYKRTALVLSVGRCGRGGAGGGGVGADLGPHQQRPGQPTGAPQTSQTVTVTGPNNSPTVTVIPPPPRVHDHHAAAPPTTTTTPPPTTPRRPRRRPPQPRRPRRPRHRR